MTEEYKEKQIEQKESDSGWGIEARKPIGVSLFYPQCALNSNLPAEVLTDPIFLESLRLRGDLYSKARALFEKINDPNKEIKEALGERLVEKESVLAFYSKLIEFLRLDPSNSRILLYLPFQILPGIKKDGPKDEEQKLYEEFAAEFKTGWLRLLFEHDVRASFVDGDVLEPSLGAPDRVSKIAHLSSEFIQKGLLKVEDIREILDVTDDPVLTKSLLEGMAIALDKGQIGKVLFEELTQKALQKGVKINMITTSGQSGGKALSAKEVFLELEEQIGVLKLRYSPGSDFIRNNSNARVEWERGVKMEKLTDKVSEYLAKLVIDGRANVGEVQEYEGPGNQSVLAKTLVKTLSGLPENKKSEFKPVFSSLVNYLWTEGDIEVRNILVSGLSHLRALGILDEELIQRFNIKIPDLFNPFPIDMKELEETSLEKVKKIVKKIKESPYLVDKIYPFLLVIGSRLKGYATLKSDLDLVIFVKPGVDFKDHDDVVNRIKQEAPEIKDFGKFTEFWIEEYNGELGLREKPDDSDTVVGYPEVHFVFGGVWVGEPEVFEPLQRDILKKYIDLDRLGKSKEQFRYHLLRQIEADIIQCRLLQKGYRIYFPNRKGEGTQNASLIDYESDFYDPGFRQVATLLFFSRVFLPDLNLTK